MYSKLSNLILGFHGCSGEVFNKVLYKHEHVIDSENDWDWLGHGAYFWEYNYDRAVSFAKELQGRGKIKGEIAVIGAVIDLGNCLNLLDENCLKLVEASYYNLKKAIENEGKLMPENLNVGKSRDLLHRNLDCAVINSLNKSIDGSKLPSYDSVRAAFIEGEELYPNAGFKAKNHIQICVRNKACIKGYFKPLI